MRILVLSDLHNDFGSRFEAPAEGYDVAIIAGDIDCPGRKGAFWAGLPESFPSATRVIYVPGNHEFYGSLMQPELAAMKKRAQGSVVHVLDSDEIVVDGVRFLGCTLWTDFALRLDRPRGLVSDPHLSMMIAGSMINDFKSIGREPSAIEFADPIELQAAQLAWAATVSDAGEMGPTTAQLKERRLTPQMTVALHHEQRDWLAKKLLQPFEGPTVVVTHHAPHRKSLAPKYADDWCSPAFVSELPDSMFEVPKLWVHGHTHTSFDYEVGGCRVICNPRGYPSGPARTPENEAFDPGLVIEI